jgi:hypothetical protein
LAPRPAAFTSQRQPNRVGVLDPAADDGAVEGDGGAGVLRLALQAQHQPMAVDDAGRRRQQGGDAADRRLQAPRLRRLQPLQVGDAVDRGLALQGREVADLRGRGGDDQLADAAVADAARLAIVIEPLAPGHAQPCLPAAGRIVDAGVDDLAVARAGFAADGVAALEQDDLAATARESAGDGQPDDSGADDDAVDLIGHRTLDPHSPRFPAAARSCMRRGAVAQMRG